MAEAARRHALALVDDRGENVLPPGVMRRTSTVTYTYTPGPASGSGAAMRETTRGGDRRGLHSQNPANSGGVEFRSATVLAREQHVDRMNASAGGGTIIGQSKRSYRDGSGVERLGVARTIGKSGRIIVRGTDGNGVEIPPQNLLINMSGSGASAAFDAEWNTRAAAIGSPEVWNQAVHIMPHHHLPTREVGRLMDDVRATHDARTRMFREEAARLRSGVGEDRTNAGNARQERNFIVPTQRHLTRGRHEDALSAPRRTEDLARRMAREEEDRLWSRA